MYTITILESDADFILEIQTPFEKKTHKFPTSEGRSEYLQNYVSHLEVSNKPYQIREQKPAVRLNTRVSHDLNEWLDRKSYEMAISKSALVAIAVENYRKETETVALMPTLLRKLEELGIDVNKLRQ